MHKSLECFLQWRPFTSEAEMAYFFIVIVALLSSTSGNPIYKSDERTENFSPKEVVDFIVEIREAGQEYQERIEVDTDKQTELFQVPAHPGIDRSDVLNDFKQHLTMLRFPDSKICYIVPLVNQQSTPEELIRDLEMAKQMVITETRRVDSTWLIDGEMTNRSALSEELADFCAKYPIYHVKEARDSLKVTGIETEERTNRMRRQTGNGLNGTALCPGGMGLNAARQRCPAPDKKCKTFTTCVKSVSCNTGGWYGGYGGWFGRRRRSWMSPCWNAHGVKQIVCCEYICNNIKKPTDKPAEIFERHRAIRLG